MTTSTGIFFIILASFALGFLRDALVAVKFGSSGASDILFLALVLPVFFENILGVAVRDALIPYVVGVRRDNPLGYVRVRRGIGLTLVAVSAVFAAIFALVPDFWIGLLAPGWPGHLKAETALPFLVGCISIVIMTLAYFQSGALNAEGRLVVPVWRSVFFNVGMILALAMKQARPVNVLIGMAIGQSVHVLWMAVLCHRNSRDVGGARQPVVDRRPPGFMVFFLPLLGATAALQVNVVAERFFASWLPEGSMSQLSYAYRVTTIPLVLVSFSVLTVMFPSLVESRAEGDDSAFLKQTFGSLRMMLLATLMSGIFMFVFSEPLVKILLQRGAFDEVSAKATAAIVKAYSVGLPMMGLSLMGGRVLLALNRGRTLFMAAVLAMATTIALDAVFSAIWGTVGLAAAAACGVTLYAWLQWRCILRELKLHLEWKALSGWLGATALSAGMFLVWPWRGVAGMIAGCIAIALGFMLLLWCLGERGILAEVMSRFVRRNRQGE